MADRQKGITLRNLITITPNIVKERSTRVMVLRARKGKTKDGRGIVISATKTRPEDFRKQTREHLTTIESLDGYKISEPGAHVKVQCNCEFFVFAGCEWVLTQYGASSLIHSLDRPPVVTNPHYLPFLCVAKGTLISIINGKMKPIEDIAIGDKVLTMDGYHKVLDCGLTGIQKPTKTFITRSGKELSVTENHLVFANTNIGIKWTLARDLEVGNRIITKDNDSSLLGDEPIVDIKDGNHDVYDLTIDKVEHFVANGFVVHNCKHLVRLGLAVINKNM